MIIGGLFVACGIIMIAGFNGITFLSVAFVLGLLFMIAGIMDVCPTGATERIP